MSHPQRFLKINLQRTVILRFSPIITFFKNISSAEIPFPLAKPKVSTYVHHLYPFICAISIMPLQLHLFFLIVSKPFAWSILSFNVKVFISNIKKKIIYDSSLNHCLSASHHCYASWKMFYICCLLLTNLCNSDFAFIIILKTILEQSSVTSSFLYWWSLCSHFQMTLLPTTSSPCGMKISQRNQSL